MKTDPNILKQFYTVLNRSQLTDEIYYRLIDIWGFNGIDLNEEQNKINQKKSTLSKSKRDSVAQFLILKKMLDDRKNAEAASMSLTNDDSQSLANDQITF